MPKATVSLTAEHFDLKTAPPDGFVDLRRMTYGQKLERQQMATKQSLNAIAPQRNGRNAVPSEQSMDITILTRIIAEYEFRHCIVDHNLEDESGNKLNFHVSKTLDILDPRIGEEINDLIAKMNNFEDEEESDRPNSQTASDSPS